MTKKRLALPADIEELPTINVAQFVRSLGAAYGVEYRRTAITDWAEAVTRNSGDDVKGDEISGLLICLSQRKVINDAQFVQLLVNHRRELARVYSQSRLCDSQSE